MKKAELILFIDTASATEIVLALKSGGKFLAKKKFLAPKKQAEKLLPAIEKLLLNQCVEDNCKTAIEYKKILTKREARKKYKN